MSTELFGLIGNILVDLITLHWSYKTWRENRLLLNYSYLNILHLNKLLMLQYSSIEE